ncbi:MAG TPA: uL15 family ribosomal protein [Candidatus Norongarragalinales archaeon]|nr:uL15 family ribosomal protein [Candidatus Norongarragalinales archaeon]
MAKRMKSNKKRKYAGNRSFGGGNAKNRRGKGNRGGVGRAGFHKHNWLRTIKLGETNKRDRGLSGFFHPKGTTREITLESISRRISKGEFKQADGLYAVELPHSKVLSNGTFSHKAEVKARAFSAKAKEKIEAAGGKAVVLQ